KESKKILEIGPGKGDFAKLCVNNKLDYTAIEPNSLMVENLKAQNINVKKDFVPPIDFPDKSFDFIYLADVFEHMSSYSKAIKLIRECLRVLKPAGRICIISPEYT